MQSIENLQILNSSSNSSVEFYNSFDRTPEDYKPQVHQKINLTNMKETKKQQLLCQFKRLTQIDSSNITKYKQLYCDKNVLQFCLQPLNGINLRSIIDKMKKEGRMMAQTQIWKVVIHITQGLLALHSHSIFHRRISMENIYFIDGVYKLGQIKFQQNNNNKIRLKNYQEIYLSYYNSPELWRDQPYDSRSDLWAFGCLIYQLTTLHPPFSGKDLESLYTSIQRGLYQNLPSNYSPLLSELISICLKRNPQHRMSSLSLLTSNQSPIVRLCSQYISENIKIIDNQGRKKKLKNNKLKSPKSIIKKISSQKSNPKTISKLQFNQGSNSNIKKTNIVKKSQTNSTLKLNQLNENEIKKKCGLKDQNKVKNNNKSSLLDIQKSNITDRKCQVIAYSKLYNIKKQTTGKNAYSPFPKNIKQCFSAQDITNPKCNLQICPNYSCEQAIIDKEIKNASVFPLKQGSKIDYYNSDTKLGNNASCLKKSSEHGPRKIKGTKLKKVA